MTEPPWACEGRRARRAYPGSREDGYNSPMKTASISQAKNRLSAYIDLVRRGESIVITDRGKPVARLAPLEPGSRELDARRLAELQRRGVLLPPKRRGTAKLILRPPPRLPGGVSVLEALIEERRSGR